MAVILTACYHTITHHRTIWICDKKKCPVCSKSAPNYHALPWNWANPTSYQFNMRRFCVLAYNIRWAVKNVIHMDILFPSDTTLERHMETWWRHRMETFSALLAICSGNSPVPGKFPTQRPVTQGFDVFFDLRLNKRLSIQSWGWWLETLSCSLWRKSNEIISSFWLSLWILCKAEDMKMIFMGSA